MTDFLTDESSIESSQPREFYRIVQNLAVTYYIASGARDIDHDGHTYVASPITRTDIPVATLAADGGLTLTMPLTHPLVARYLAQGSPPRQIQVTAYRKQLQSGEVEQIINGVVTSMAIDGHVAKFLVQSNFKRLLARRLPTISAGKLCPHILYDASCRLVRSTFTIGDDGTPLLVTAVNGRRVTLDSIGGQPDHWAQFGELIHVISGERMSVVEQVGTTIDMQAPIPELQVGSAVYLSAGCAHDIVTCQTKFANQVNFGGFPQLPTKNPFVPTGFGVIEQE